MIRKRLQRIEEPGTARFLTFSCFHRIPLFNNDGIKSEFVSRFNDVSLQLNVDVLAWVIMPEHVHLVVFAEMMTMDRFLKRLKGPFSHFVIRRWKQLNSSILDRVVARDGHRFLQAGGGYDRNVIGDELLEKIRYCHANPVERGLVKSSIDWPWSSARRYENRDDAIGPMIRFDLLPTANGELI